MEREGLQGAEPQTIGRKGPDCGNTGKIGRARVKARHMSQLTRQIVLDLFAALESSEEVATRLGVPARTVSDILTLAALKGPKPSPASGIHIVQRREAA